jgi:hypothetical protein
MSVEHLPSLPLTHVTHIPESPGSIVAAELTDRPWRGTFHFFGPLDGIRFAEGAASWSPAFLFFSSIAARFAEILMNEALAV